MPRTTGSKVILAKNIRLDRQYTNVIDYTESQLLSLLRNDSHIVKEVSGYSFIRQQNSIQVNISFSQCLQSNYIAFQNADYSNKWFFAFIDDVKYIGDNNTEILYTIDAWSTFFSDWKIQPCFVVREHVNNDEVGVHTLPENVELGEYINNAVNYYTGLDDLVYIIQCTEWATQSEDKPLATNYGGVFMARRCLYY